MFPINPGMVELRSAFANDIPDLMPGALQGSSAMGHHLESSDMSDVSITGTDSLFTHHLNPGSLNHNHPSEGAGAAQKPALDFPEVNSRGKYAYESEFLRSLQNHPLSLRKPDLPDLEIVHLVPLPQREKQMRSSRHNRTSSASLARMGGKNSKELRLSKSKLKIIPSSSIINASLHGSGSASTINFPVLPLKQDQIQDQDPDQVTDIQSSERTPLICPTIVSKLKSPSKSANENIKEKKKSLLPLSNITENCSTKLQTIQDVEYLLGRKFTAPLGDIDAEVHERCLLFFDKYDIEKLVEKEIDNHKKNKNFSLAYQVSALNGNLKETITEAARANQLNDWLVAMSASISREFWSKTALLYAMQLEKSNECAQAAFYYSSLHRITDAVRVLLKAGLYKESLILVKNCAPFNTQLTKDILNVWAKNKESQDNLEFAAKIYVANLEAEEAARCLAQRKDDPKCQSLCKTLVSVTPLEIKPDCI